MTEQQIVPATDTRIIVTVKPNGTVSVDVQPPKHEEPKRIILARN